jgi:PIN domain nuclease of toxin-antitoxin system
LSDQLLLDTHIALWLDSGDRSLRPDTRTAIDECWGQGGRIYLSAVSVWEIAMLVDGGRVALDGSVAAWTARFFDRPGIEAVPLSLGAAMRSYDLPELEHRDPADRLLIATAIEIGCPLVTYDRRIRRFGERHGEPYGLTVIS